MFCKTSKGKLKGHSLLELSIVLGIIAISTGSLLTSAFSTSPYTQLNRAATLLANDIRYAQQLSIQTGTRHRININMVANTYSLERLYNYNPERHYWLPISRELTNTPLQHNANFSWLSVTPHIIEFTTRGTLAGSSMSIHITNDIYQIILTTTVGGGRVYIYTAQRII